MKEYIPHISNKDINRLILREFDSKLKDQVYKILNKYISDSESGRNRVWAAIIKLSVSSISELEKNTEKAIIDFRDVIAYAEYPGLSDESLNYFELKDGKIKKEIIKSDKKQYLKWLDKNA